MFRKKSGQKGFTLVELMIVVAIIGILAIIFIPRFSAYRAGESDVAAVSITAGGETLMAEPGSTDSGVKADTVADKDVMMPAE